MEASTLSKVGAVTRAGHDSSRPSEGARPPARRRARPLGRTSAVGGVRPVAVKDAPLQIGVLDRDSGFLVVLAKRLERLGWEHRVLTARASPKRIAAMTLDALVVDPVILGPRCWDWLERLCQAEPEFRIVICTGSWTVTERVHALRVGADDWLSKPCHPEELVARIEAVMGHGRRPELRNLESTTVGEVEIRRDQYQAFVADSSLNLTRREFEMVELLTSAGGEIVGRELIYERLWGHAMLHNERSVDVFVHKLRRKLQRASPRWRYIHAHFGVGYRLAPEPLHDFDVTPLELELVCEPTVTELAGLAA